MVALRYYLSITSNNKLKLLSLFVALRLWILQVSLSFVLLKGTNSTRGTRDADTVIERWGSRLRDPSFLLLSFNLIHLDRTSQQPDNSAQIHHWAKIIPISWRSACILCLLDHWDQPYLLSKNGLLIPDVSLIVIIMEWIMCLSCLCDILAEFTNSKLDNALSHSVPPVFS